VLAESPHTCTPENEPYVLSDPSNRNLKGRDWVLLGRCDRRYVQRVGRSPESLGISLRDFAISWLASDASYAFGTNLGGGTTALVERFADGRPDKVLFRGSVGQHWVSPDGKTIAFQYARPIGEVEERKMHLYLLRTETSEIRDVSEVDGWIFKWSPDSQKLLFQFRDPSASYNRLAWTSWDSPERHSQTGTGALMYDLFRGTITWAPDSCHLLIYNQNPMLPGKLANLVTLDLEGHELTNTPIVGADGQQLRYFDPYDIMAGNPLIVGHAGLLDQMSGKVTPLSEEGVVGWSSEPGKLLRWRMTPEGPTLDTVLPEQLSTR
jgi:hypothetical protein